jgi:hypothetical protein
LVENSTGLHWEECVISLIFEDTGKTLLSLSLILLPFSLTRALQKSRHNICLFPFKRAFCGLLIGRHIYKTWLASLEPLSSMVYPS